MSEEHVYEPRDHTVDPRTLTPDELAEGISFLAREMPNVPEFLRPLLRQRQAKLMSELFHWAFLAPCSPDSSTIDA